MKKMDKQQHAEAIRQMAEELGKLIQKAEAAGLEVSVHTRSKSAAITHGQPLEVNIQEVKKY